MSRSVRRPLTRLPLVALLAACGLPAGAHPADTLVPPATQAPIPPVAPTTSPAVKPAPSQTRAPARTNEPAQTNEPHITEPAQAPRSPAACGPQLVSDFGRAFQAEPEYAYRARGWNEFKIDGRRGERRIRSELTFEGARQDDVRWWRRIDGGVELHDEAVGDGSSTWLRLPLWRSWQEDSAAEAEPADPLGDLLAVDSWQVDRADEGCLLVADESSGRTSRELALRFDRAGRPTAAMVAGQRPNAPAGEGIPAAWRIDYAFSMNVPELPTLPPAALPNDDQTALAMLAANDAPGSRVLWRDLTKHDEVLAFAGPEAYGFLAWDSQGALTDAAVLDRGDVAADLLEFYRLGELGDETDDELNLVAIVLDEQVTELVYRADGQPRQRLALSAPGRLIGPLDGYLDGWHYRCADGSRVPLPGHSGQ